VDPDFQIEPEIPQEWHHLSAGNKKYEVYVTLYLILGTEPEIQHHMNLV
jgi:hypothetical protein